MVEPVPEPLGILWTSNNGLMMVVNNLIKNKRATRWGKKNLPFVALFFDTYEKHFYTHGTILHLCPPPLLPGKNLH